MSYSKTDPATKWLPGEKPQLRRIDSFEPHRCAVYYSRVCVAHDELIGAVALSNDHCPSRPGDQEMHRHGRLIAFLVTTAVSLMLTRIPLYSGETTAPDGQPVTRTATLIEVNGLGRSLAGLGFPVVLALAPLLFPRLHLVAAILMLLFALVSAFTIGMFYIPSALLLFWARR
jgi:hypothetical protein